MKQVTVYFSTPVIAVVLQLVLLGSLQGGTSGAVLVHETVPDGTTLRLGQEFTKSWTVKSVGGVSLTHESELRYISGSAGCNHTPVNPISVVPPVNYTFSITCTAPKAANTYTENWELGSGKFWVTIKVDTTDGATLTSETIPKATIMPPGQSYTKQWTLKNSGNTAWGNGFELKYASGNAGCSHDTMPINATIPPDGSYSFSINCTAPSAPTTYRADWKLISPRGTINVVSGGTLTAQFAVKNNGILTLTSVWQKDASAKSTVSVGQNLKFLATVKDSKGNPVPTAQIPVSDGLLKKNSAISADSNGAAIYSTTVPTLPDGSYVLTFGPASKQGYTNSSTTRLSFTIAIFADQFHALPPDCQAGLIGAMPGADSEANFAARLAALNRARAAQTALTAATKGTDINWQMLAAFGIEESQFRDIDQKDGDGKGIFQIDIGQNPSVTADEAHKLTFSADWATKYLTHSEQVFSSYLTGDKLTEAVFDSYNAGVTGELRTIKAGKSPDSASSNGHYGTSALELTKCFQ